MDGTLRIPTVTGIDVELRIAGPGGRSYAFIIDWHIRALIAVAWLFAGSFAYLASTGLIPSMEPTQAGFTLFVAMPSIAIYFLYHPVLEVVMRGRTPGKRIAGVRIVKRDGGVPSTGALLVRNLFRIIDSLPAVYCVGLAATMTTKHSVRIGDIAAGTLLVYDEQDRTRAFTELSSGGVGRLGLERAGLVRDLLGRWEELDPAVRSNLARRLLAAGKVAAPADAGTAPPADVGTAPPADAGTALPAERDGDLRGALERLLR